MRRWLARSVLPLAGLTACLAFGQVQATEGGVSFYIPGLKGPLAGVVPPPGFYFQNDLYLYNGEFGRSRQIEIGGAVVVDVKQESAINFATPIWVTPVNVLGGNLAFSLTMPFGVPRVTAGALIEAPRLGRTFNFSRSDADFSPGDPVLTTFVGWHSGKVHWATGVSLNVPAGAYEPGQLSNVALNRFVADFYGAVTYLDPELGFEISANAGLELNGRNLDTDYNSGNAIHIDVAASKFLSKELSIGVIASHYQQVSGDTGGRIGPFEGRTTAVGGTIGYTFVAGTTPISTRIKILREVAVENRFHGTIGLVTVAFPIGGPAGPKQ
jgi:hypothetical protein